MSDRFVIVGGGPVGRETATLLREAGHEVVVATRSGQKPDLDGIQRVALDATDTAALSDLAEGATALLNCANPPDYTVWAQWWPPLAESLLTAAERSGATLVTAAPLYAYGPVDAPMTESTPDRATDRKGRLRAEMWGEAQRRHAAGRIHAVEVRGSDYVGGGVGANGHVPRLVAGALRGRTAWVIGDPDLPHTWTDVRDMGRTLVAVATDPTTWGQVWHAPSNPPRSQREALTEVLAAVGAAPVAVRGVPHPLLAVVGRFSRLIAEIDHAGRMLRRPYVMDSSHTQNRLGLAPSPWEDVCLRTATGNGGQPSASSPIGP